MPIRDSYRQGTPCWVDLLTANQGAAKTFYGGLFGWTFDDRPMPPGPGVYSVIEHAGGLVGAIAPPPPDMAGMPAMWNTYLAVDDVDEAARQVFPAGGRVLSPPFDVLDSGRMAVVCDPSGAVACLWQAKADAGSTVVNEPGAVVWNELITDDVAAASAFYEAVLGLHPRDETMGAAPYTVFEAGDAQVAGAMSPAVPGVPNHWLVYFGVEEAKVACDRALELGGSVFAGPFEISIGATASIADPHGAVFGVFAPSAQPG